VRATVLAVVALLPCGALPATAAGKLVPLVQGLEWSGVSGLIGYQGRLWFANSVKFVNHNSADVYSYDPQTGRHRYEKHLFSQDAGDPVVAGGLLYWPFEDARFSPGRGEFMVTNGTNWSWHVLPKGRAFHTHAMAARGGTLYAASSAWRARLLRSRDRGAGWQQVYVHQTPDRKVSRITVLAPFKQRLYAGLTTWYDDKHAKLLRWLGESFAVVGGWPAGSAVTALAAHLGWLYAVNVTPEGSRLWRTDGRKVEGIEALDRYSVRALAAGAGALWAVSSHKDGGRLWRSQDGRTWSTAQEFRGPRPLDVAAFGDGIYVGMIADRGGELWGPKPPHTVPAGPVAGRLPQSHVVLRRPLKDVLRRLDKALAAPRLTRGFRRLLLPLTGAKQVGVALAKRLQG
jgi:hypothetical protein